MKYQGHPLFKGVTSTNIVGGISYSVPTVRAFPALHGVTPNAERPAMRGLILEFRCGLPLQAARFKIGLRLDRPHHRFHLGDHDAGFDFLLRPFPQGFTRSWQTE